MLRIKVFISYSQNDTELATALKSILEESSKIDAFVFEQNIQYGIQIDKKITNEIDQSDYLIAIITQNTHGSASVNQELGYAQGCGIDKIAMVEEKAKKGVLTYGTECSEFSKIDFKDKCMNVKKYILNNGPKFTRDKQLIAESAYYRYEIEYIVFFFLNSVYYRFNINGDNSTGLISNCDESKPYIRQIEKFFSKRDAELINHMSKIDFEMYGKINSELMSCKEQITNAERFPHEKLTQMEKESITELKENVRLIDKNYLDVEQYCRDNYNQKSFYFTNCHGMKQLDRYKEIQRHLRFILNDLQKIILLMIKLAMLFLEYRKVFGQHAFKNATLP